MAGLLISVVGNISNYDGPGDLLAVYVDKLPRVAKLMTSVRKLVCEWDTIYPWMSSYPVSMYAPVGVTLISSDTHVGRSLWDIIEVDDVIGEDRWYMYEDADSLLAELNVLKSETPRMHITEGEVYFSCYLKHTNVEFISNSMALDDISTIICGRVPGTCRAVTVTELSESIL